MFKKCLHCDAHLTVHMQKFNILLVVPNFNKCETSIYAKYFLFGMILKNIYQKRHIGCQSSEVLNTLIFVTMY